MDFRYFVLSEDRHFMLGATHNTPFALPQPVLNVLNSVDAKDRHAVLKWIMSEGLRKSLLARKNLADQLKAKGYNLGQDGVFSPTAYQKLDINPELQDKINQVWHSTPDAEPTFIPVADTGKLGKDRQSRNGYNLADINAHLVSLGQEPLHFGGTNGLIEYIEDGKWRTGDYKHKDINKNSRYGKQGHDLSLPPDSDVYSNHGDENNPSYTYKYGLGGGMHVDPNSTAWGKYLSDSERYSQRKILSILDKKKKGEPLSPEEESVLSRFNINTVKKPHTLRDIAGLNPRSTKTSVECPTCHGTNKECENCHGTGIVSAPFTRWDDPEDYVKAKACIKAYITWMFSSEPDTGEQNLSPGKTSKTFTGPGTKLPDVNNMNPNEAIDRMMKAIFPDDAKMLMANSPYLEYHKGGKRKRNRLPIPNLLYGSDPEQNGNKALNWYLATHPSIDIDINGAKQSVNPQDIVNFKKEKDVVHYNGNIAGGKVSKKLVPADFNKLNDEGYVLNQKRSDLAKDGRQIWELPGTEQSKILFPKDGKWFEYAPEEDNEVDVEALTNNPKEKKRWAVAKIDSPHNKHGNLYQMTSPDGKKSMLVRKTVDASGQPHYFDVPQLASKDIEGTPILGGHQITPNAGKTGVKQQMYPFDPETGESGGELWNKAVDDFKQWNPTGLRDTVKYVKGADSDDAISHVLHQIDNIGFWYGSVTGRGKDAYLDLLSKKEIDPDAMTAAGWKVSTGPSGDRILLIPPNQDQKKMWAFLDPSDGKWYESREGSANLNAEQAQEVFKVIKDEIFGNKKQVEALPEGDPNLYKVGPNTVSFQKDIVGAIQQMGNRWRQSKATNWVKSDKKTNAPQALGSGSGSDENDYDQAADMAVANDDDDAPYAGEDDEEIQHKGDYNSGGEGDDEFDWNKISNVSDDEADAKADEFLRKSQGGRKRFVSDSEADTRKRKAPQGIQFPLDVKARDPLAHAPTAAATPLAAKQKRVRAAKPTGFSYDIEEPTPTPAPTTAARAPAPVQPKPMQPKPWSYDFDESEDLSPFAKRLRETGAVYDPNVKVKDGCGFNWWGAVGKPGGVSITGDPIKKGNRGRKR